MLGGPPPELPLKQSPLPQCPLAPSPALTWRDVQHLAVRASRPAHLQAEDWAVNGVGRKGESVAAGFNQPAEQRGSRGPFSHIPVSHHYGYGLLDAALLVELAQAWAGTRPQQRCSVEALHAPR